MENQLVPYQDGYDYGIGVQSSTGGRRQAGAVGAVSAVEGASGGSGGFQMTRIETNSDLEDKLSISADASGGVGLFSASDRFDFCRSCKVQSQSITLMLFCEQNNGFTQIKEPALDAAAGQLVASGDAALFAERYGDCFVAGQETGGRFFGVIRLDTKTEADRQTVENALSGSYGPFSADVSVAVQSAMTKTQTQAYTYLYHEGGTVNTKPQTPKDLFAAANEWSNTVGAAPKPYKALLLPWTIANGPKPPNEADLEHQRDVLVACAKLRSQVLDRLNLLEYMTDPLHTAEFVFAPADPARLATLHAAVSGDFDMVAQAASYAIEHAKDAMEVETFARTVKGIAGYTLTPLPPDLPKRVDGSNIVVPNVVGNSDLAAAEKAITDARLTVHYICTAPQPGQPFRVVSQDPPAGVKVAAGATVTIDGNRAPFVLRRPPFLGKGGIHVGMTGIHSPSW